MKYRFNFFSIFLLISLFFIQSNADNSIKKNVLIINSYHNGYIWSDKITKSILNILNNKNIPSNVLYLNSLRVNSKEYTKVLEELYSIEINKYNYETIITIDTPAYKFVKRNYKKLRENQKIVFVGSEVFDKQNEISNRTYGILNNRDIVGNIKLIQKFFPNIKKLHIINNNFTNIIENNYQVYENIIKNKELEIIYYQYKNIDSLVKDFNKFEKDEIILFIKLNKDENNAFLSFNEISHLLSLLKLPTFITDTLYSGHNVIGGKLVNINSLGEQVANITVKILNNEQIKDKVIVNKEFLYIFNYEKIKEFKLNPLILHKPFSYVNSYLSFFEKDNILINFVFILSPFLLLLIFLLLYILFFRIKSTKLIEQRIEFDKVLLNAIKTPVVWQNDKGDIINSNLKFDKLLKMNTSKGISLNDFLKNNGFDLLLEKLRRHNKYKNSPKEIVFNDNQEYKIFLINQTEYRETIFNTKGKFTVFVDITKERLALEEKIKHQEFMIQQSKLAEVGEIFSSIAHQWKTPLLEITTIAQEQIYSTNSKDINEENNAFVNDIMMQVKYMGETISDFQNFIMPSTRKVTFDISSAITKMLEIINHNMKYNYINTNINVQKNANLNILGYKNELMQILLNIVNNAKDAIVRRKKEKKIKQGFLNIDIKNIDASVLIQIEDNGGGIPKEHINNIFKPYYTTKENGHGIGLYMAKLIIEDKMDGTIWVENTENGAKFSIKLAFL